MRGEVGRRRRSAGQWCYIGFAFCFGAAFLAIAAVLTCDSLELRTHGVRTTAAVEEIQQQPHDTEFLVGFTLADGTPYEAWTTHVDNRTRGGETITVLYLPRSPGTVQDVRVLGRWWIALVFFPPFSVPFFVLAWFLWRAESDLTTRGILRGRYIRRRY